jgi:hypothetical protein
MNEDAVWAILANELAAGGPMSDFLERSGANLVDRRTSHHPDPVEKLTAPVKGPAPRV